MPEQVPVIGYNGKYLGKKTRVSFADVEAFGEELSPYRILSDSEARELAASGKKEVVLKIHEGRFGMNWYE